MILVRFKNNYIIYNDIFNKNIFYKKKYKGGMGDEDESENNVDQLNKKLEKLEEALIEAENDVRTAKEDWNRAAEGQMAQPDYFWVNYYEDNVDELKKEIKKVEKKLAEIVRPILK